ncbi:hypothetical protein AB0I99_17560 [Streptomyces spongiicola]|uniref:hypothetical protein n=1 Tax=Streptomyces spongiicola TaxID=1690221 RepID=UPI0033CF04EA
MNTRTIILAGVLAVSLTGCGSRTTPAAEPPAPTPTASPSPTMDAAQQMVEWRDSGGMDTLQTLMTDLSAVQEDSDPVDLNGLRDSCSTLTANLETARGGTPMPHPATAQRWKLALEHLTASAKACSDGAVSGDQSSFDLMASEMDIGIKHMEAVAEHIGELAQ